MSSQVKIKYFNTRGRAELSRMLMSYGGQTFEDSRVEFADWGQHKDSTPIGSMPVITLENGNEYSQGTAIARYFASKYDLLGKSDEERLHADMVVDTIRSDMWPEFVKVVMASDAAQKEQLKKEAREKWNFWLGKLEAKFVRGTDTFLASGFSWADVALFNVVNDIFPLADMTSLDTSVTPKLNSIVEMVRKEPKIAAWVAKRPVTIM
ncbi:glutathione S-transferase 3-like [Convolutriloba macropyga]|uniref:glutathione S-transferase 3-like n=1 Tax=Convolutriloba macropyga TaxID=536237 RepID=UPI003F5263FC